MTSIEWLIEKTFSDFGKTILYKEIEQAKEMHKKEMEEMYLKGIENYDPTFKIKDDTLKDFHIVDTTEMVELPQQDVDKLGNEDVPKLGYCEISDEEIEKQGNRLCWEEAQEAFKAGAKWYREQLKLKQPKKD